MRSHTIENLSASYLLESELFKRKGTFLFSLFVFLTSMFTGIFFGMCIAASDKSLLAVPIIHNASDGSTFSATALLINIVLIFIIYLSGLSIYAFPLSIFILIGKAIALGFCISIIYSAGQPVLLISLITSSFILMAAFVFSSALTVNYAVSGIGAGSQAVQYKYEYTVLMLISLILVIIASLSETVIMYFS